MIRKYGIRTYDDAKEEATALLWEFRKTSERMRTTNHTKRNRDGEFNGFSYIKDDDTGAIACIYSLTKEEDSYIVVFLTAEECKKENIIYPFRDVTDSILPFILSTNALIVKPTKAISIDEAFTTEAQNEVNRFFGDEEIDIELKKEIEQPQNGVYTIDNTFVNIDEELDEDDEDYYTYNAPDDSIVENCMGAKIRTSANYIKAISKLLNTELTEAQEKEVREHYEFTHSYVLIRYAIYEFFRTEDYNYLKEILSKYKEFGLPKDWEKGLTMIDKGYTAEEYIIANYLFLSGLNLMGLINSGKRLKDIAEYTNTPYRTILRASRNKYIIR